MIEKRAVAIIVLNIVIPALGCNGYPVSIFGFY